MKFWRDLKQRISSRQKGDVMSNTVMPLLNLASSYLQNGNYTEAKDLLLRALGHRDQFNDPKVIDWILSWLALIWERTEQYRERTEFFSEYITKYPEDAIAYILRAASHWYAGDANQAIDDYSRALELDSDNAAALSGRGQVFGELGEPSRALRDLDLALQLIEETQDVDKAWKISLEAYTRNGRAAALAALGEFDSARKEFEKSIALCPQNAWVYFNRAQACENRGDRISAIENYRAALEMKDPKLSTFKRAFAASKLKMLAS